MKVPDLLQNVYRDLRDRRMLSISAVLVAAIIAVPFLLGGGGDSSDAPLPGAAPAAPFEGSEQLSPVVLADVPGLRDFRERLDRYQSHNPFKQQPTGGGTGKANGSGGGKGVSGSGNGPTTSGGTTDTGGSSDPAPTVPSPPTDTGGETTVPSDSGSSDTGSSDGGSSGGGPSDSGSSDGGSNSSGSSGSSSGGSELISYELNVRVGPVGDSKVYKDVKSLSFLPDPKHPLVQYIQSNPGGTAAAFIVNPRAAALKGDGKCARSRKDCQYLLLEKGQEMFFLFEDQQYRIQLKEIKEHRESYGSAGGSREGQGQAPAGRGLSSLLGG